MPDEAKFWDKHADGYAKKKVGNPDAYHETLEQTRKHLSSSDEVLEVGCGTGTTALHLAPGVKHITGTDISSRMIEIAREKAVAQGVENVGFEQATLSDDALPKGPFDVVLAFNLLHLLEDLPGALRRLHGLLRPGGTFVSKTICLGERTRLFGVLLTVMKALGFAPYVRRLKIAELEEIIRGAGFEIVETGLYPPSGPSRFVVARKT